MLDELPKTFRLILVYHVYPPPYWLLNTRSVLRKLIAFVFSVKLSYVILSVKNNRNFGVWEVHVAICFWVVDSQAIVVVDIIVLVFVGFVGDEFENDLAGEFLCEF